MLKFPIYNRGIFAHFIKRTEKSRFIHIAYQANKRILFVFVFST